MASRSHFNITFKDIASQGKLIGFIREAAGFWGLLCGRMGTTGSLRSSLFQFFFPLIRSINFHVYAYFLWERLQAYLNRKMISHGLENPTQRSWPEGCTLPSQPWTNSFSSSSVVVIIMLRQEYLVECQKCRISLNSFAAVTTSFPFPSSSVVLHSCTCTFSDPAQGLFCKNIHCRLCSMQVILCYIFPRVYLVRRFFIEPLLLVQFSAFLGKSSSYLVQWGCLIKIHEDYKNSRSKWNISLH